MRISPAQIVWRDDGTPYSPQYGDIYHSAAGGLAQAQHVFLGGNGLPDAWRARSRFVIVETGFGLGTNFLATWAAWRADPQRPARLFFVSLDLHPPTAADLRRMHADGPHAELAAQLAQAWPLPVPGLHGRGFEDGAVQLLLGFGEAQEVLRELALRADAFYLDGFAPARNPDMWSSAVARSLAKLAAPQATLATYTAARAVRDALTEAGFEVSHAPGFAGKRDMTIARYTRVLTARHPPSPVPEQAPATALVIGGGVAGCASAHALAARGVAVTLLERREHIGAETSSNRMGALQPLVARDDNLAARFTRAGFFDAVMRLRALAAHDPDCAGLDGLLHLAVDAAEELQMADIAETSGFAQAYVRMLDRTQASAAAGVAVTHGGWWFEQAGWVIPPRYAAALLATQAARIEVRTQSAVETLVQTGQGWAARDAHGHTLAQADAVVVAAAHATPALAGIEGVSLQQLRGQVSELPAACFAPPRVPVAGDGYVLPARDGWSVVGATYEFEPAPELGVHAEAHAENLARLTRLLAGQAPELDLAQLPGRVGWRAVAPDRMPLAGLVPDGRALAARTERHMPALAQMPRLPGLACVAALGSRGIAWAGISAALVTAQLCGDPWPIERVLADAVDPARFALRRMRRGH